MRKRHKTAEAGVIVLLVLFCSVPGWADVSPVRREIQVLLRSKQDVDFLTREGCTVAGVHHGVADVYVTSEQLMRLRAAGYRCFPVPSENKTLSYYPSYDEVTSALYGYTLAYPSITKLISIGTSVEGRNLWALLITDNPEQEEDEPEFRYVGGIHGDEKPAVVVCMNFIEDLLKGYGNDATITELVNNTAIWIVPMVNPDGCTRDSRYNADGFDLNRSFPVFPTEFSGTLLDGVPLPEEGRPPETIALMEWTAHNRFVLSAWFHSGSVVVNYPYDDDGKPSGIEAPTPDDALFRYLALQYASRNPSMANSTEFPQGITNGSAWYVIHGGVQDWSYRYTGCAEVTIELSFVKEPAAPELATIWTENESAMLAYLQSVHLGIRGIVSDAETGTPLSARVDVAGNTQPVFTDPDVGDYHRLLLPGTYTLTFSAPGYVPRTVSDVVVTAGSVTRLDISLEKDTTGGASSPETPCPAELVLNNRPAVLYGMRLFRDHVLQPFSWGRYFVRRYYRLAPRISSGLLRHPYFLFLLRQVTEPSLCLVPGSLIP